MYNNYLKHILKMICYKKKLSKYWILIIYVHSTIYKNKQKQILIYFKVLVNVIYQKVHKSAL